LGKYTIIIIFLLIFGLLGTRFINRSPETVKFQLADVVHKSFDVTVNTVGVLDAARSHMVSSSIRGDKGKIIFLVEDGAKIETSDILVKLDATPFEEEVQRLNGKVTGLESAVDATMQILEWEKNQVEREIKSAEYNLTIAKLDLKRLIQGDGPIQLTQYKEEMEKAKEEYNRYTSYSADLNKLNLKGYTNLSEISLAEKKIKELKEKYDSANSKYVSYKEHVFPSLEEKAKAAVEKAEMEYQQIRKGSVFKIAKAASNLKETESNFKTAQSSLKRAKDELQKTIIKAPFSGIAILFEAFREGQKRKPRIGDKVWQNQPLLYLPDISSMIVKTQVREVDLHKINLKQKCIVKVDAYPESSFEGTVTFIGVLASERVEGMAGEKYFQLQVVITNEDSRLRPGMTSRITILSDQAKNVLTIPIQAIFEEAGFNYCYKFQDNKLHKVKITVGRQNEDIIEIKSGLTQGDKVSLLKPEE